MDVSFDRDPRKIHNPQTRIFSPTQTGTPAPVLEDASMPVRPQPTKEERTAKKTRMIVRLSTSSKVLILLSVFAIAATALLALFGSAEYARIVSDTATVNSEIETYNEQISQIRKSQSSMNDFATINEICRNRGMTMNWDRGDSASGAPVSSPVSGSAAPQATPAATPETNGD